MAGWVKLHRQILNWEWYSDINVKVLFIHCLVSANYEQKVWRGVVINPGQFYTSLSNLSLEVGISVKAVRIALDKLRRTNDVHSKRQGNGMLITVVKYKAWQVDSDKKGRPGADLRADLGTDKGQQHKNIRNKEEINTLLEKEQKVKKFNFKASLIELGVDKQFVSDWLVSRKIRRLSNTPSALDRVIVQFKRAKEIYGMTPNDCVKMAAENSWGGFNADWVENVESKEIKKPNKLEY